ncbi:MULTISPECIES: o-succinylbenzoate--CoA ligase [Bacillus]|uniref:o-succinylbenzoate--CoA ligase n=1 Tax=Bacillus TaxID=1386 RepID=UPI00030C53E6|nr:MULTISPECIES: o-succinylbenzoate--CoA ligase [Bacillus]
MQGIAYWIEKRAVIHPESIAIITDKKQITYRELNEQINKTATFMRAELRLNAGERVAILSQNRYEYIVLLFAIAKLECIAVPLNIRLTINELSFQLQDSETRVLFGEEQFKKEATLLKENGSLQVIVDIDSVNHLENEHNFFEPINENASYLICYTSGTTGKPKGAVLTQANMFWNAINNTTAINLTSNDRTIVLLPLFHIGGIGLFAFPTLFMGGTIVIPGKFEPEKALTMMEEHQVTIVMGVPAIHDALLHSPSFELRKLTSVRWFYNGGAPCPHELIDAFFEKGFLFGQGFGMSETSPTVFMLLKEDAMRKKGSIGKPALFCDFQLVDQEGKLVKQGDVGEIVISGPNVMKGYWNRPEVTKETIRNGWLYTGDLARVDEEGFVYIVGRKKDMIISGGENIYPLEIEQVFNKISGISEVAVIGRIDEKWGEVPIAFVVAEEGSFLTSEVIIEHCKHYLAKYKIPKEIIFIQELPKNATGKVQKNLLDLK